MHTYKDKDSGVVLSFGGQWVTWAHTALGYAAFVSALFVGLSLHYRKIVENEFYGFPDEWFPSVSATIGDRYPERNIFMFFIATTTGPRFALVGLWYLLTRRPDSKLPELVAGAGILRTFMLCGWTYVTSTDDHDSHDVMMISYLVLTLPWTIGCFALSPSNPRTTKYRKYFGGAFFGTLVPMIYWYIQHKLNRVAGAYTIYAFFEWSLVLFDVAFDAVSALDFHAFEIIVRDARGSSKGEKPASDSSAQLDSKKKNRGDIFSLNFPGSQVLDTAADVYHGFVFWTILTSLGVVVWYFPLWFMGISGYEVFIMTTTAPAFLAIRSLRPYLLSNLRTIHLLSLSGLAAFLLAVPRYRLFAVGFGVSMTCLGWAGTLYSDAINDGPLEAKVLAWMVGLILSVTAKYAWQTNNPIWPIMHEENGGWNMTGLVIAVIATLRFTRKQPPKEPALKEPAPKEFALKQETGPKQVSTPKQESTLKQESTPTQRQHEGSAVLAAFGVAGLFFGLHSLLTDTSTMILWVWEGYPNPGPDSATHGWCTLAAMSLGLFGSLLNPVLAQSWSQFITVGANGALLLTFCVHWIGYYGGLALAAYLMSMSVPLLSSAARKNPGVTFGLGFLIYNVLVLFHVWVVAYAFVPGGPLVRERTDWVMLSMMLCTGAGIHGLHAPKPHEEPPKSSTSHRKYMGISTTIVNILFLSAAYTRLPTNDYQPYHPEERVLTAGIWTTHFSLDNHMWSSEHRMRDLIRDMELDVVGLLESDLQRIIMGNRDTTQFLAEELGMYVDYGPGPNKHTWGAALLSKFPIVSSTHHLLPSPDGELAPAIHATLYAYDTLVDVFVFHSGQKEDKEDRRLQAEYLAKLMGSTNPRPAILLSYLVTRPHKDTYNTYVSEISQMRDVDATDKDRWCEYILFRGLRRVGYARVSRGTITDTELQVAKFVVEADRRPVEQSGCCVREGAVPEEWKFPKMFRDRGVRGHRYHVIGGPRYYN